MTTSAAFAAPGASVTRVERPKTASIGRKRMSRAPIPRFDYVGFTIDETRLRCIKFTPPLRACGDPRGRDPFPGSGPFGPSREASPPSTNRTV